MTAATDTPAGQHDLPDEDAVLGRASGENFSVASLLLGRANRDRLMAIYGFARLVDELGDSAPGDRAAHLDRLEVELERAYRGVATHPILTRLAPVIRDLGLPRELFARLIEANRRDQQVTRYETFDDLLEYCLFSANPVGELVLAVFGATDAERVALSDRVCTALQLAEHWQDVAEDRAAGRIYLPTEDMHRFDVTADDLDAPATPAALRRLMAFEVDRARALLDEGAPLVGLLRGRARLAVAGYVGGGRAALDALVAADFDVLAGPPRAGKGARVAASLRAFRTGR